MEKKEYIKPSFKEIEIKLNDFCVGSVCTKVDIFIPEGNKLEKTKVFTEGNTDNMWDHEF